MSEAQWQKATFGGGCFWCVEAIVQRLKGVQSVVSGYSGGAVENPSYREVCGGRTGHAEVIQVMFDEEVLSYSQLLGIFMTSHDPTTLNRQGADSGTQYRSIILYHSEAQKLAAEAAISEAQQYYDDPIVTEIAALERFYPAEEAHQNYYNDNGEAGYCRMVISPKVEKLRQMHQQYLAE